MDGQATAVALMRLKMLIGGRAVDAASGRTLESENPYSGRGWAVVPDGGPEDVDAAAAAARTTWKVAPALAAGCTVVVKPSEHSPACTPRFAELFELAGFPSAVRGGDMPANTGQPAYLPAHGSRRWSSPGESRLRGWERFDNLLG